MIKLYCIKCHEELGYDTGMTDDELRLTDINGIFVHPCKRCCISENTRKEHRLFLNFLNENEITYSNEVSIENGLDSLTKKLSYIDNLEGIINKIIPEYKDIPLEFKILLLKERVNNIYITSKEFYFNEQQINELVNSVFNKNRIAFIKNIRNFLSYGLKDAKNLVDSRLPTEDFARNWDSVDAIKKMIIERF